MALYKVTYSYEDHVFKEMVREITYVRANSLLEADMAFHELGLGIRPKYQEIEDLDKE